MRTYIGYAVAAIVAIALYLMNADPFWQMVYTVLVVATVATLDWKGERNQ